MKSSTKHKLQRTTFVLTIVLCPTIIFLNKMLICRRQSILFWEPINNNVSCHNSSKGDALKPFTKKRNPRSIFFHETSCRGGLTSRQACAVESAAKAHPDWQIYLLFNSPVTWQALHYTNLYMLQQYPNIDIARIHTREYTEGLWPADILQEARNSTYGVRHFSDILRFTTLFIFGGVYLDLDLVVLKALDDLPNNWIARQLTSEVGFGAMALSKDKIGTRISRAFIREISHTYDADAEVNNDVITNALKKICPADTLLSTGRYCHGLYVFGPDLFYPLYYTKADMYFSPGDLSEIDNGLKPYMHHMWNGMTSNLTVHKNSPYAKLAKEFCPLVYEMYGDQFGV